MTNICLHTNNFAWVGGIGSFILDFARTFPEYQHIMLCFQEREDYNWIKYLQSFGVRYMNSPLLTQEILKEINPALVVLHNTRGKSIEGEWPYSFLNKYRTIALHHASTWPLISVDLDYFVSKFVRKGYDNCQSRIKKEITMPPCVWSKPYVNIKRKNNRPITIGRVQSYTGIKKNKTPVEYIEMLKEIKGDVRFITVGGGNELKDIADDRFIFKPVISGGMPQYLSEIDIFAVWPGDGFRETWSRVVTEAMLSGIPIVARDVNDGMAEQITASQCGFLAKDKDEFIQTIQNLVDDDDLRETTGKKCQAWALENASEKSLRSNLINYLFEWSLNQ